MLKIKNLEISRGLNQILKKTDLEFNSGLVYTLYGSSGIGKTSFLNSIGLLSPLPNNINYEFNEKKIDIKNNNEISKFIYDEIGHIYQSNNLISSLTVYENLAISLRGYGLKEVEIEEKIDEILNKFELYDKKYIFPSQLSGGQEQRVAIARALISNKSIILADEPTHSLDKKNRDSVMNMLINIAHKHNKIVIIVSHDTKVVNQGDVIYRFEDKNLVLEKSSSNSSKIKNNNENNLKMLKSRFIRVFNKKLSLSKFLIFFITVFTVISVALLNVNKLFIEHHKTLMENAIENGILVINDTLGIESRKVYDDFLKFSDNDLNKILKVDNVETINSYIEFPSQGLTFDLESSDSNVNNIVLNDKEILINEPFTIQPLYDTNVTQRYTEYFDYTSNNGIFISKDWIKKHNLEQEISNNASVTLTFYVPIALFKSTVIMDDKSLPSDGDIYVQYTDTFSVNGIIDSQYPYNYSIYDNSFFMSINSMINIQRSLTIQLPETFENFEIIEWAPSAVHISLENNIDSLDIIKNINNISSNFSIVSSTEDYEKFNYAIDYLEKFFGWISIILLIILIFFIFILFYLLNRSRKIEVGLFKSQGLSVKEIIFIYVQELFTYSKQIIYLGSSLLVLISIIVSGIIDASWKSMIQFYFNSVLLLIPLSLFVMIMGGCIPIYSASLIKPTEIIEKYK